MAAWYELWDSANASLVGTYDTEADALGVVRRSLEAFGTSSVATLILTLEEEDAEPQVVAAGDGLTDRAREGVPSLVASPAAGN